MFDSISIPFWLVVVAGVLALVALLDRVIGPSFRWFFKRKANRTIEELNTRLKLRIQPFKTTKRQALIDRLLLDGDVITAIEAHIKETGEPLDVAQARAERYAREIVPAFNAYAYSAIGTRLARWICTFVYRVRLGYSDDDALAEIDEDAAVVFVMNHRSNMDYVLVTYLASASAMLSYAVGEWARVWLLQNLIRAMGAYFIRRDSGNLLYRRVLARYVAMATKSGVTQAIFPEGGLSRDGLMGKPKFGLFGYMLGDYDGSRDIVFVPVGLNYDRVLEDRSLLAARGGKKFGKQSFRFGPSSVLAFLGRMASLRLKGRLYKYGYACASFGNPVSLKDWLGDRTLAKNDDVRFKLIEELGRDLMDEVGKVIPVLPVSLVALSFEQAGDKGVTELELKSRALTLMKRFEKAGAHIHLPREDHDYAISAGLRMLTLRHFVIEREGRYFANPDEEAVLAYYANAVRHLLTAKNDRTESEPL